MSLRPATTFPPAVSSIDRRVGGLLGGEGGGGGGIGEHWVIPVLDVNPVGQGMGTDILLNGQ